MTDNPFLAAHAREAARMAPPPPEDGLGDEADIPDPALAETVGPQSPLNITDESTGAADHLPLGRPSAGTAAVCFVSLHGGAGASTLVDLMANDDISAETVRQWPAQNPWTVSGAAAILVARTHGHGLERLRDALTAWHAGGYEQGIPLAGVCLVDDGPHLSKAQQAEVKRCMAMAPHGWRIPWDEDFRFPAGEALKATGATKRALRSIRKTADKVGSRKDTK